MFTGIIEEIGNVISAEEDRFVIAARETLSGMKPGGSIAVNGVCLTVTGFDATSFTVDVMPETLRRTNLGRLHRGANVNLESPLALGGPLGGHLVQGHIDATGEVASLTPEGEALLLQITAPPDVMRYTVPKGFITVDGTSLTIAQRADRSFHVSLVAFTRRHTTLGEKKPGDPVNLEADIIAKYVAQFQEPQSHGVTYDFLAEHGFVVN
ncbi:riboflavin synthase [Chloroflexota bacterium]